jgi:hypothetical protein
MEEDPMEDGGPPYGGGPPRGPPYGGGPPGGPPYGGGVRIFRHLGVS